MCESFVDQAIAIFEAAGGEPSQGRARKTDCEVWIAAGNILAEHGAMTADYIIDKLSDVLDDDIAVEDWRRVAAAVDEITSSSSHDAN